jgi:hypothetical protein
MLLRLFYSSNIRIKNYVCNKAAHISSYFAPAEKKNTGFQAIGKK